MYFKPLGLKSAYKVYFSCNNMSSKISCHSGVLRYPPLKTSAVYEGRVQDETFSLEINFYVSTGLCCVLLYWILAYLDCDTVVVESLKCILRASFHWLTQVRLQEIKWRIVSVHGAPADRTWRIWSGASSSVLRTGQHDVFPLPFYIAWTFRAVYNKCSSSKHVNYSLN